MAYVILQPHSATNPSRFHQVVNYAAWVRHANSGGTTPLPALSESRDYADAQADCDARNATLPVAPGD